MTRDRIDLSSVRPLPRVQLAVLVLWIIVVLVVVGTVMAGGTMQQILPDTR